MWAYHAGSEALKRRLAYIVKVVMLNKNSLAVKKGEANQKPQWL